MTPDQIEMVKKEFEELVQIKYETLNEITFDDLDLNPYILKIMNLQSADEIAEFMITQRVERSLLTTYGHRIQKIARAIAKTPKGAKAAEIVKEKDHHNHHIHLESGPHSLRRAREKGVAPKLNELSREVKALDPGAKVWQAMPYGNRARLAGHLPKNPEVEWLVGREFWAFIADDPDCAKQMFEIACRVSEEFKPGGVAQSYRQMKRPKVLEISQEIQKRYGHDETEMWKNLFENNV